VIISTIGIGHAIGAKAYTGEIKWIKKEYMERTHAFYEKHGGKTNSLARFVPIIRTFSPFVAGAGNMPYGYFLKWDIIGGVSWGSDFHSAWLFLRKPIFCTGQF